MLRWQESSNSNWEMCFEPTCCKLARQPWTSHVVNAHLVSRQATHKMLWSFSSNDTRSECEFELDLGAGRIMSRRRLKYMMNFNLRNFQTHLASSSWKMQCFWWFCYPFLMISSIDFNNGEERDREFLVEMKNKTVRLRQTAQIKFFHSSTPTLW